MPTTAKVTGQVKKLVFLIKLGLKIKQVIIATTDQK